MQSKTIGMIYPIKGHKTNHKTTVKILENGIYAKVEIITIGLHSKFTVGQITKLYNQCICNTPISEVK